MRTSFYNIAMDIHTTQTALEQCEKFCQSDSGNSIFFVNAHCFNVAQKNERYREVLNEGDLILNDGIGIKLAALLGGIRVKENMNGTDFIPKLLAFCQQRKIPVFLLGSHSSVMEQAKNKMENQYPGLTISGYHHGYFSQSDNSTVIDCINHSGAEVLIVGMGVPTQEIWIRNNMNKLNNVRLAVAGGAVFDFFAERVQRAPYWIRKMGMEWLYRLAQEPVRLFNRYIIGNVVFVVSVISFKIKGKQGEQTMRRSSM